MTNRSRSAVGSVAASARSLPRSHTDGFTCVSHAPSQPEPGRRDFPANSGGRQALDGRISASVKPPKYLQLDNLRLTQNERSQVVERFVERHDIEVLAA